MRIFRVCGGSSDGSHGHFRGLFRRFSVCLCISETLGVDQNWITAMQSVALDNEMRDLLLA